MTFQIHDVVQGTEAWHQLRFENCTASEAPIMMGDSSKGKRNELLTLKKTGVAKAVSDYVQKFVFDPGHEMEATQRKLMEDLIGEDLYPTTATRIVDGIPLLASTDGQTMAGDTLFEHKGWNEELAAMARSGDLSGEYYWQLEQQLLVFGAEKVLFVVSDGTAEKRVIHEYFAVPGRSAQLLGGWHQFRDDLGTFEASAPVEKLQARSIENLPALVLQLNGGVAASNLAEYKAGALALIEGIKTELVTDQDFVDAEAMVKFCKAAEDRIKVVKKAALENTADIKAAFETLDELGEAMRQKRLKLDKQVISQKAERKDAIRTKAEKEFLEFIDGLNKEFAPRVRMPEVECDIAGAMSGKRNLESIQDAADTTVAKSKIKATELAMVIRTNLAVLRELDPKYRGLFNDVQSIILKDADDFANLVKLRIKEADDAEAEAERVRLDNENRIREEAIAEATRLAEQKSLQRDEELKKPAEPEPAAEEPGTVSPDGGRTAGAYHVTRPSSNAPTRSHTASANPVEKPTAQAEEKPKNVPVPKLVSLDNLIVAILDGVVPQDMVQVNQQALDAYIAQKGHVPPGFTDVSES